jgi:hypothetical protein
MSDKKKKKECDAMRSKILSVPPDKLAQFKAINHHQHHHHHDYQYQNIDDMISCVLIKWTFKQLLLSTHLMVQIINKSPHIFDHDETIFANNTPIKWYDYDQHKYVITSFRLFYNHVSEQAHQFYYGHKKCDNKDMQNMIILPSYKDEEEEEELEDDYDHCSSFYHYDHDSMSLSLSSSSSSSSTSSPSPRSTKRYYTNLMKGCFIIGFSHDIRIRRFVMARHYYHYRIMKCVPPNRHKIHHYLANIDHAIKKTLSCMCLDISEFTNYCIDQWINNYITQPNKNFSSHNNYQNNDKEEEECSSNMIVYPPSPTYNEYDDHDSGGGGGSY